MNKKSMLLILIWIISLQSTPYFEVYDNLNEETVNASINFHGDQLSEYLPLEHHEIQNLSRYNISWGLSLKRYSDKYGNSTSNPQRMENLDMLKHITFIYRHQKKIIPFLSYYTPFKSIISFNNEYELTRKSDCLRSGLISIVGDRVLSLSVLGYQSQIKYKENNSEYIKNAQGIGFGVNFFIPLDHTYSVFAGYQSPIKSLNNDKNYHKDKFFFPKMKANLGLIYQQHKNKFTYSATYQKFKTLQKVLNSTINYQWIISHSLIYKRIINKNVDIFTSIENKHSSINKPEILNKHQIITGIGVRYKINNMVWNFLFNDSSLFSDENLASYSFQFNISYHL